MCRQTGMGKEIKKVDTMNQRMKLIIRASLHFKTTTRNESPSKLINQKATGK